jgi:hypothetical protein
MAIEESKFNDKKIVLSLSGVIEKYSISGGKVEKPVRVHRRDLNHSYIRAFVQR